jgi:hypothetical protein
MAPNRSNVPWSRARRQPSSVDYGVQRRSRADAASDCGTESERGARDHVQAIATSQGDAKKTVMNTADTSSECHDAAAGTRLTGCPLVNVWCMPKPGMPPSAANDDGAVTAVQVGEQLKAAGAPITRPIPDTTFESRWVDYPGLSTDAETATRSLDLGIEVYDTAADRRWRAPSRMRISSPMRRTRR